MKKKTHSINKPLIERPLVGSFLDISTGHIKQEDNRILRAAAKEAIHAWEPIVYKYMEGQFVHVPAKEDLEADLKNWKAHGLSAEFCNIMRQASKQKLWFVRFDADGMIYSDLKTFEW